MCGITDIVDLSIKEKEQDLKIPKILSKQFLKLLIIRQNIKILKITP